MMEKLHPVSPNTTPSPSKPGQPLNRSHVRRGPPAPEKDRAPETRPVHHTPEADNKSPARPLGQGIKAIERHWNRGGNGMFAHKITSPFPVVVLALIMMAGLGLSGCQSNASVQWGDATDIEARDMLILPTQPLMGGFSPDKADALVAEFYQKIETQGLGIQLMRLDAKAQQTVNTQIWGQIGLYAATLTEVGISEPVMAQTITEGTGTHYLMAAHFVYMPCTGCPEGPRLGLVGQIIRGSTGLPVWRAHEVVRIDSQDPAVWEKEAGKLAEKLWRDAQLSLTPKWHKLRFKALAGQ